MFLYLFCLLVTVNLSFFFFFFFNDTATTEIYTLSLHDALPISALQNQRSIWIRSSLPRTPTSCTLTSFVMEPWRDRKSTRLNSSHLVISYAVFCLKKKKTIRCGSFVDRQQTLYPSLHISLMYTC